MELFKNCGFLFNWEGNEKDGTVETYRQRLR